MSLTDRDRKILLGLVPLLLLAALWFLVFAPKHSDASKVAAQLTKAEASRDKAKAKANTVATAKTDYAKDYETVVRLGKAIPSAVDTPSLIVQLSRAAKGTHISFRKIKAGTRAPAAPAPAATSGSSSSGSSGSSSGSSGAPVASGGQTAQSGPGKATENANNGQQTANNTSSQTENANPGSTSGSGTASGSTTAPAAPGAADATGATGASSVPGLDTVPLEFGFDGSFFDLADFFHRMKRFVHVANENLRVGGRLMTIDSVSFDASTTFPTLTGEIKATVYLAPKDQGTTAGATPSGPAGATPAGSTSTPGTASPASATTSNTGSLK